jgi:RNA polymerase sigma-70 factor (ECF subfamily)
MKDTPSDTELFDAFVAGDAAAFAQLWDRHAPPVRRFLRSRFGSRVASEDFLQEAFLSLAQNRGGIRDPRMLRHYLITAARRMAFIERRREKLREQLELAVSTDSSARSVDHESRETLRKLHDLVERLSPRRRAAFTLYCIEQRNIVESSKKLGVSPATFRRELEAARHYLGQWMAAEVDGRARAFQQRPTRRSFGVVGRPLACPVLGDQF